MTRTKYFKFLINSLIAVLSIGFLTGCSSESDMDTVRSSENHTAVTTPKAQRDDQVPTPAMLSKVGMLEVDLKGAPVGDFMVKVPKKWTNFGAKESADLRRQYMVQSEEIYRQFSGSDDSSKTVDISAFHISGNAGSFVLVSFTVPPQSKLVDLLKSQVADKMAWGVREGYIREYLGLVPVDNERLSGFYTKAIGNSGAVEVSGALEHENLKNTIIQLTLISPKNWDEGRATKALSTILESVKLNN